MSSPLIANAVMLLAHKRLTDFAEALESKLGIQELKGLDDLVRPSVVRDTDRRILELAKAARGMLQAAPTVPTTNRRMLGQGVSRFAIMGAVGFDLADQTERMAANAGWMSQLLRRGSPDPQLSRVVTGSTQFAIRLGEIALGKTNVAAEQQRIRAFAMGMICTLAANVAVNPVLRGLLAETSPRDWQPLSRNAAIDDVDERISKDLLADLPRSQDWEDWWPDPASVPEALFEAYGEALTDVFQALTNRPQGTAEFETAFQQAIDDGEGIGARIEVDDLRDAYSRVVRNEIAIGGNWNWFIWALVLLPVFLMVPITLLTGLGLPHAKFLLKEEPDETGQPTEPDERSWFEILTMGTLLGGLPPFAYSMALWAAYPASESNEPFINAIISFVVFVAMAIGFGVTAGREGDEDNPTLRWLLFYGLLALDNLYFFIRGIVSSALGNSGRALVFWIHVMPVVIGGLATLFAGLVYWADARSIGGFWLIWALVTVVFLLVCGLAGLGFSRAGGISALVHTVEPLPGFTVGGGPRGLARLFDDSTLWHLPAQAAPGLDDLSYPSGTRVLLRMWWDGDGELKVSHDDHALHFQVDDGDVQDIVLPPTPTTAGDLATLLTATVVDASGAAGHLQAQAVDPAAQLYPLPYPHGLADPGDSLATLSEHEARRDDFVVVSKDQNDPYELRHAPRRDNATPFGSGGPSAWRMQGDKVVPNSLLGDLDGTTLGQAADLASLLCMGAAPSLSAAGHVTVPGIAGPAGQIDPVHEVFRQWNLDERRINEWHMLVRGGALSEKAGHPEAADPAMRPGRAGNSSVPGGEALSRQMGWVPLWRAWSRMATDATSDSEAAAPMPYTPAVRRGPGPELPAHNRELSEAMRFLLDLP